MIVETSANELFTVKEPTDPDLGHCWLGLPCKRVRAHGDVSFALTAWARRTGKWYLVRKEGARIIDRDAVAA